MLQRKNAIENGGNASGNAARQDHVGDLGGGNQQKAD